MDFDISQINNTLFYTSELITNLNSPSDKIHGEKHDHFVEQEKVYKTT